MAKRALGNAPWRYAVRPEAHDVGAAWDRMRTMALDVTLPWEELALRFSAYAPGVSCAIVGTTRVDHLAAAAVAVAAGPLGDDVVLGIRNGFDAVGSDWPGIV